MSENALLWLGGLLFAVMSSLIAVIYWQLRKDINEVRALAAQTSFAAFLERDRERENQWYLWRGELEKRLEMRNRSEAEWRHDKCQPFSSDLQNRIGRLEEWRTHMDKWKNGKVAQ